MWFEAVIFFIAAIGALAGALGVVILRNPFYSVLALVCHLVALAVLFLLLNAEFLAAGQVVVYAGAVMVLYLFVVAYIGGSDEPLRPEGGLINAFGPLFAVALGIELCIAFVGVRPAGTRHGRARRQGRLRLARRDRRAASHPLAGGVRGGLVPAARGGGGRRGAGPAPARARGGRGRWAAAARSGYRDARGARLMRGGR